jgi:hypothetical protein
LGEDFVGYDCLSKLIRVVSKSAKRESSGLLDAGYVVQQ